MSREVSHSRCLINGMAFSLLALGTALLRLYPDWFDRPVAISLSNVTGNGEFANRLAIGLAYPTLQGVILVCLVWYCWFSSSKPEMRARILIGAFAAVGAALIAHFLQHALPLRPRPIFDPVLEHHLPHVVGDIDALRETSFANSPSFPSERATMFAGLAIVVFLIRRQLGLVALGCTAAAEFSRVYLGLHYATDIMESFFLAAAIVWFARLRWGSQFGLRFVRWERVSASSFYMCAFFASYQLTTAFQDLRQLTAQLLR